MIKSNLKSAVCAFMVGILLALSVTVVLASTATSTPYYYSAGGYDYYNQSAVSKDSNGIWGQAGAYSDGSGNIPTGYMGVQANLYNGSAELVESTGWFYNSSPSIAIISVTDSTSEEGTYLALGYTRAYDDGTYDQHATHFSPYLAYP